MSQALRIMPTLLPAEDWASSFQRQLSHKVQRGVSLSHYTSIGIGGPATLFGRAGSRDELAQMILMARRHDVEVLILDDGRRLLVGDWGFDGFAVRLEGELNSVRPQSGGLAVGGACGVGRVLETCLAARIDCSVLAEFQGQVGAAVLRASARQKERLATLVRAVEIVDWSGRSQVLSSLDDLPEQVAAITRLDLGGPAILDAQDVADRVEARRMLLASRTPSYQNLGAVLRLEDGQSAARAVQEVGLAGLSMGPVAIPKTHADTVINLGGATARDVLDLIDCVAARLYGRLELTLDPDLRIVGNL